MKESCAFFTLVSDDYYYPIGAFKMINSFKRFHPDIDLIVFRQEEIEKVFLKNNVNFYNAKPTFAKLLTDKYDLIVNIDADNVVLGRLDAILSQDYEVGGVMNLNDYQNREIDNVGAEEYLNAGLIASRNKKFWDIWEEANKEAEKYICKENDIMNLVIYNNPEVKKMKLKVFDKDYGYYGCKSLNREGEFYLEGKKVMCRKEQVFVYHHAKGAVFPKLQFETMGFPQEVVDYMNWVSMRGVTEVYGKI